MKKKMSKSEKTCPDCHGEGVLWEVSENYETHDAYECERCKGTGTLEEEPRHG